MSKKPCIGITVGDFNGIGPELVVKTLSNELVFNYCTPVVYGSAYVLKFYTDLLELAPLEINTARRKEDIKEGAINLRVCSSERIDITPGQPSTQAGKYAFDALQKAVEDVKNGLIQNILTAPIDKNSAVEAGLKFNGHTQYFASEFESEVQMILLNDSLRVAMVTGHTALTNVAETLSSENILKSIQNLNNNLKADFMYHDQVLIPFKQVAFADGINYTAGLPIIRTSPDHGTAYDIAGKGVADTSSFINALYLINKIHRNRLSYYDSSIVPLEFKEHRREKFSIGVPNLR